MITIEPNKICYIFDLDGTLTEPREAMNLKFAKEFSEWMDKRQCLLATGSDFLKAKQQIPRNILDKFQYLFCCMANEIRDKSGKIIHKSSFVLSDELDRDLAKILKKSKFHLWEALRTRVDRKILQFCLLSPQNMRFVFFGFE